MNGKKIPDGWTKKSVQTVASFNDDARERFLAAVEDWNLDKRGGFPSAAMYLYLDEQGEPRTVGWVVAWEHSHEGKNSAFFETYEEAAEFYHSDELGINH